VDVVAYGIILLPDEEVSERIVKLSNDIAGSTAIVSLDARERPPHLTISHIEANQEAANQVWSEVKTQVLISLPVQLTGLMFNVIEPGDYYVPEGAVYFGIEARCTETLRVAHASVLEIMKKHGASPLGVTGDGYAPHVALGQLPTFPGNAPLPTDVLGASFDGHLAFGRLGNYGTFPEILDKA
jgi:2'-5' RNA ligase